MSGNTFKFANGAQVTDSVTGFTGAIITRADYLAGCNSYCVQPKTDKEGKFIESRWFDEERLMAVSN